MLNKLRDEIYKNAVEHGLWDGEHSFGDVIAMCHTELSEAYQEYRSGREVDEIYCGNKNEKLCDSGFIEKQKCNTVVCSYYKPEGIPIELADCIITILSFCGKAGIDIDEAIMVKHEYNKTRPYKHGGKVT